MRLYRLIILNRKLNYKWKQDGLYTSLLLKKFINHFIFRGNINRVEKLIYKSFLFFKYAYFILPIDVLCTLIEESRLKVYFNIYPKGRSNLIIPKILTLQQSLNISIKFICFTIKDIIKGSDFKIGINLSYYIFSFLSNYMFGLFNPFSYKKTIYKLVFR